MLVLVSFAERSGSDMFQRRRALRFASQDAIVRDWELISTRGQERACPFEAPFVPQGKRGKRAVPHGECVTVAGGESVAGTKTLCCHMSYHSS
jgi:hypothetical protein